MNLRQNSIMAIPTTAEIMRSIGIRHPPPVAILIAFDLLPDRVVGIFVIFEILRRAFRFTFLKYLLIYVFSLFSSRMCR